MMKKTVNMLGRAAILAGLVWGQPVLAEPVATQLQRMLDGFGAAGYLQPVETDLSVYPDVVVFDLWQKLQADRRDPCVKAVRAALYLNMFRPPSTLDALDELYKSGLAQRLATIWVAKDEGDLISMLAWGWGQSLWTVLNSGNKAYLTYEAFIDLVNKESREHRAAWMHEIVDFGLHAGWTADHLPHVTERLDAKIARSMQDLKATQDWTRQRAAAIEEARRYDLARAREKMEVAEQTLRRQAREIRISPNVLALKLGDIQSDYAHDHHAALDRYTRARSDVMVAREGHLRRALWDLARARVQAAAVTSILKPILLGDCPKSDPAAVAANPVCPVGQTCKAVTPSGPPPAGGHWALVQSIAKVTVSNTNSCYEKLGRIDAASAHFTNAKPRCGAPWDAYTVTYNWTEPPAYLVPDRQFDVSVSVQGDYAAGWGNGGLFYYSDLAHTNCGAGTAASRNLVSPETDGFVATAYNRAASAQWRGQVDVPGPGYGDVDDQGRRRFQIKVTLQPMGCMRYIYEWRDTSG